MITVDQLNKVAALLNTTDKNLVISVCIKTLVDAGMSVNEAIDAVLGAGQFDAISDRVREVVAA